MQFARLETRVENDEGFSAHPYLDTVGVATIGYGTTEILGRPVTLDEPTMTAQVARQLLRADLWQAALDAQSLFACFDDLNDCRQEVLVNMAYNLGKTRLAGFKRMIARLEAGDYAGAANEMQDSKWYRQVGQRSKRLVQEMRGGTI